MKSANNERGLIQFIIIFVILLALGLGVYLVQTRTNLLPKAFNPLSGPISGPVTSVDTDGDGFSDSKEQFMGTDPSKICATSKTDNAWPVDTNNDTYINGADVSLLVPYISGSKSYSKRYDLNQDGKISESDVSVIQPYMLRTCVPTVKDGLLKLVGDLSVPTTPVGQDVTITLAVSSPQQLINIVSAQIKFPADKLSVKSISMTPAFSRSIEEFYDNTNGTISIIRGNTSGTKTSSDLPIAKITFTTIASGISYISFDKTKSELLRIEDGDNILQTQNLADFTVTAVKITPEPTAEPTVKPTITPSSTPQVSAAPSVVATPISTSEPSPNNSQPCTITNAQWSTPTNPVDSNTTASLTIEATGDCANKQVDLTVLEDDGLLGADTTQTRPDSVVLVKNAQQNNFSATATWITEFQEDGIFGTNYPPEYRYTAQIAGDTKSFASSGALLQVLRSVGIPSPVEGDLNGDAKANLTDLSTLLAADWTNTEKPSDTIDVQEDGEINTADFSKLVSILKQKGVLRTQ